MFWILLGTSVIGLILGLRFRAPAVGAASALVAIAATGYGWLRELGVGEVAVTVLAVLVALQLAYFAGVLLSRRP